MSGSDGRFRQTLLVEELARIYRFDDLAERLPGPDVYPPYLFVGAFVLVDFGVVNAYKLATGYEHILVKAPTTAAGPLGVMLAAVGTRYMTTTYPDAIGQIYDRNRGSDIDFEPFEEMVSRRTRWVAYAVGVAISYVYVFFELGIGSVVAFEGPAGLVNVLLVWQLGYLPFVVEFALVYFSIHFLVPRRIARAGIPLFHYDPRNMGGFAGIGQLLKRSYYVYTVGLFLHFVTEYGPFVLAVGEAATEPGLPTVAFFSTAWFVGVLSIAYSMLRMHQIMAADKERRIRELETQLQEVIDGVHDIESSEITDTNRFEDIQLRLEEVRSTRVYPATFTMWSQIGVSALLPQALQFAIQVTT